MRPAIQPADPEQGSAQPAVTLVVMFIGITLLIGGVIMARRPD